MFKEDEIEQYSRHLIMEEIGPEGQQKLKDAKVLVIGAGGLGCPVLQYLAGAGVGTIGIADHDRIEASNLQRQVLYGHSSIGKLKAEVARQKLSDLNPYIQFDLFLEGIHRDNALEIITPFDVVVDCTDNFGTRYLINDACILLGKAFVYGAIHKFEGQLSVFNYKGGPSYRCLHPSQDELSTIANCEEAGVIGVLPGIIGALQANEVLKMILNKADVLSGKLLVYSALKNSFSAFKIEGREHPFYKDKFLKDDYDVPCKVQSIEQIVLADMDQLEVLFDQFVDVREANEEPKQKSWKNIPLSEIDLRFNEIDPDKKTLVICRSGNRSEQAIKRLQQKGYRNLTNLKGGILTIIKTDNEELF